MRGGFAGDARGMRRAAPGPAVLSPRRGCHIPLLQETGSRGDGVLLSQAVPASLGKFSLTKGIGSSVGWLEGGQSEEMRIRWIYHEEHKALSDDGLQQMNTVFAMDVSENNICDTEGKHSNYPRKATKQEGHSCSLHKEVDMNYSCSPPGNSARSIGKQELPAELQYDTCDTCCQKQGEGPAGEFALSSNSFHLQSEDEDLGHCSSERLRKPQTTTKLREDNGSAASGDVFDEALEPVPKEALPHQCKKCGSSFCGMSELQVHRRAHLLENSYHCPVCAKAFSRAANLRMHKLIHSAQRPHKCPECDKGFIRTADVWRHLRNVHKIERSMVVLASGMVRNPWSMVHHSQHSVECPDRVCPGNPRSREDDFKPYACPTCGKGFDKPNLLSKHKVIHREDKPYKCQECGMAFVQLLRLKRHQQTHSGARPFYCEECGGTFTRLASLQRHHRIHTGEKPYSCNFCGHSFTESGTLRRHERTHKLDKA